MWKTISAVVSVLFLARCAYCDTVRYEVTFDASWSRETHPDSFPPRPHFSGLIGGTHNDSIHFWEPGGIASPGIERMAETGSKSALQSEVNAAISDGFAGSVLSGGGIGTSPNGVRLSFDIDSDYSLVTLVSMIAPSPDWFVGVDSLNLLDGDHWVNQSLIPLPPYDSGTDSGPNYTSGNADTNPAEPIFMITGAPFENAPPLGTFTFRLITGDLDGSGSHTNADIDLLTDAIVAGSSDAQFDLNGDGAVDLSDHSYWVDRLFGTLPGDANLDSVVDGSDFNIWNSNKGSAATWATGDFNGDQVANEADLMLLQANLFSPSKSVGAASTVVPEPGSSVMVLLATVSLFAISRRRN